MWDATVSETNFFNSLFFTWASIFLFTGFSAMVFEEHQTLKIMQDLLLWYFSFLRLRIFFTALVALKKSIFSPTKWFHWTTWRNLVQCCSSALGTKLMVWLFIFFEVTRDSIHSQTSTHIYTHRNCMVQMLTDGPETAWTLGGFMDLRLKNFGWRRTTAPTVTKHSVTLEASMHELTPVHQHSTAQHTYCNCFLPRCCASGCSNNPETVLQ